MMYRVALSIGLASALSLSSAGCGLLLDSEGAPDTGVLPEVDSGSGGGMDGGPGEAGMVDGGLADTALDTLPGMSDAGPATQDDPTIPPPDCGSLPDFTTCHTGPTVPRQICIDGDCIASLCGDGELDLAGGEVCDDGDVLDGNGCANDCTPSCTSPSDCDDGNDCNGAETCGDAGCQPGSDSDNGDPCANRNDAPGACSEGHCAITNCYDFAIDSRLECDDGNVVNGDGCNNDCTLSCRDDMDCASSATAAGSCSVSMCVPVAGGIGNACEWGAIAPTLTCYDDEDGDGFGTGPATLACGTRCFPGTTLLDGDCDDSDVRTHPGTRLFYAEQSNGGGWDFDCNGADVRFGGFRAHSACTLSAAGRCTGGGWESSRPACGSEATYITCRAADECMAVPHTVRVRCR